MGVQREAVLPILSEDVGQEAITIRILVTGNAGFVARHLMWGFADTHEMHGIDRWTGDLHDPRVIRREIGSFQPDLVIHLAAKVGRLFGEDDPLQTIRDNTLITTDIACACRDMGVRLAYASTSEVYGDQGSHGCLEEDPFDRLPHNIYGLSKRWGEEAARLYTHDPVIFRLSMPYGPGLPAGRGRAALINMLHQALHRQPIVVHKGRNAPGATSRTPSAPCSPSSTAGSAAPGTSAATTTPPAC
jgi:nucleoside-diphosphate-sugar epimerase